MKRSLGAAAVLFALLAAGRPAPGKEIMTRYDPRTGIGETTLANGLTVLTLERRNVPVVSCQLWYRVGSADEHPGETGLAHFLEHLMFKGTGRLKRGEIDRLTLVNGGANNAATYKDWTYYYFNFASDRWTVALDVEADRMRNLAFDPADFEAERKVILEELFIDRDGPWGELTETAEAAAYLAHPYRNPVIGHRTDLETIPLERVKAFYDQWYHPNHAVLVLVGDFDTREALAAVVERFGKIPAGPPATGRRTAEPSQNGERRILVHREAELVRMEFLYHGLSVADPDEVVLDVIRRALTAGKSSRLIRRLVEERPLATAVDSVNDSRREPGLFWIYVELQEDADPEEVEQIVAEEAARLAAEGLPEDELARAKKGLLVETAFDRATAEDVAEEIGGLAVDGDWGLFGTFADRVRAVTAVDVRRVAGRILRPANGTIAVALPAEDEEAEPAPAGGGGAPVRRRIARRTPEGRAGGGPRVVLAPLVARLSNGLTLLAARHEGAPVVAIDCYVDAGRRREATPGLARFTGQALLEGAAGRDAVALDEVFASFGAEIRTSGAGASLHGLSEDAESLVPLFADVLLRPDFPAAGIERVRERTISEIRADADDPQRVAHQTFDAAVYGPHPLGRPEKGDAESIAALTREQVVEHHRRFLVPGSTVIAAVSDRPAEELLALLLEAFDDWTGETPPPPELPEIPAPNARRIHVTRDTDQANVVIGHRGVPRNHEDYYPLLVLDHVLGLGPGFTDRLSRTIRDRDGLAYQVYATITRNADLEPGTFTAFLGTAAEQRDRAIDGILAEIRRIRETEVDAAELADAKAYLTGSFVFGYETAEQIARRLVDLHRLSLGFDHPEQFAARVAAVTAKDVLEAARTHLAPDALTIVTVGPGE